MHKNAQARYELLQALYEAREIDPHDGWVSLGTLNDLIDNTRFALDMAKELELVIAKDFKYRLTAKGVLGYEAMQAAG